MERTVNRHSDVGIPAFPTPTASLPHFFAEGLETQAFLGGKPNALDFLDFWNNFPL
jgi:hypothetical protein